MTNTVLILGPSGKIGRNAAQAFAAAGWNVRPYKRGTDMTAAAIGADVIVNGLNPPNYENWEENIPRITKQVIAAAKASGATIIIPANVYNFGDYPGVWDENTPHRATTRKGKIRIEMEEAYRRSGLPVILLRAGNFIDPTGTDDVFKLVLLRSIKKGRVTRMGRTDIPQSYCYVPDWANAAVQLAEKRDQLAQFEDIPFPGHTFTMQELKDTLETQLDRPLRFETFPWWILPILRPFWAVAAELPEMRYLWNLGHQLSGEKFSRLLPDFTATPFEHVVASGLSKPNANTAAIAA